MEPLSTDHSPTPYRRSSTGVMRLDEILQGGLIDANVYLMVGPSGSGKTVLAAQIAAFRQRCQQGRTLFITLLSETHLKLIHQLSGFTFFDPQTVGKSLIMLSGYPALKSGGMSGLQKFILENVRALQADFVVIDGLDNAAELATSNLEFREFVLQLQSAAGLLPCTILLLSLPSNPRIAAISANVDAIIELDMRFVGSRMVRQLAVKKLRGSGFLPGRHYMNISPVGIVVDPLMEVRFADAPPPQEHRERFSFGIDALDQMCDGGLLADSTTLLMGPPGTGKTLLGLSFLVAGAERGEQGIFFGFYEAPGRLVDMAEAIGLPLRRHVESGAIVIMWHPASQTSMDALTESLLERLMREEGKYRCLVFDGLSGLRMGAVVPERFIHVVAVLINRLRALGVCTIFTEETRMFERPVKLPEPAVGSLVDAVLALQFVTRGATVYRLLSVLKMRESAHDPTMREFQINQQGVFVAESDLTARQILQGDEGPPPPSVGVP